MSWCIIVLCVASFSAIVEEQSRKKVVATESDFYFFYLLKVQLLSIAFGCTASRRKGILLDYFGSSHIFGWFWFGCLLFLGGSQIPSVGLFGLFCNCCAIPCSRRLQKSRPTYCITRIGQQKRPGSAA